MPPEAGRWVGYALNRYNRHLALGYAIQVAASETRWGMRFRFSLYGPKGMP